MKKLLKVLGIVILVILIALIALPYLFRGQIFDLVQEEANKNLNATVSIESLDLSLFENFPDFTVTISNIKVDNKAPFEGTTLASIGEMKASLDLMSVLSGSNYSINTVGLSDIQSHVIVLPDGTANYDITVPSDDTAAAEEDTTSEASSPFNVKIKEYYIRNAHVIYDDQEGDMYAELDNLTHEGKGDFSMENFLFETKTTADAVTYKMDGITYLNKVNADIDFNFKAETKKTRYTFMDNVVRLNDLTLGFDGWVAFPGYPIVMDMTFEAKETDFKSILSLVPAVYKTDFEDVKTEGSLALNGRAKGTYVDRGEKGMVIPGFDVSLMIKDGMFQYPDMPGKAENIQVDLKVSNEGRNPDLTVVDLKRFHLEMAGNPIDANFFLKKPMSNPDMKGALQASIDLVSIADVIPMEEGESYEGNITSDIKFEGRMSAIDEERYEDFTAEGNLIVLGFDYQSADLPYPVKLKKLYMNFSPQYVDLSQFEAYVGASDFSGNGRIDNMLGYYFSDEPLTGSFTMNSKKTDVNELMGPETEETTESDSAVTDTTTYEVVEVPGNINFVMTSTIDELIYDNIEIKNLNGKITISDSTIYLDKVNMELMDGSMQMTGKYGTKNPTSPEVDFGMDINNFDVQQTVITFNTVEKMAPLLKSCSGKFSTDLKMTGRMDSQMEMLLNTLTGNGSLTTHNVEVDNDVLEKIDGVLKSDNYNPLKLNNVNINYEFKDGKITTEPFDVNLGDSKTTISGYSTFEETLDYTMDVEVPMAQFGGAAQGAVNSLLSQVQAAGVKTGDLGEKIKVKVKITGDITDPTVKPVFEGSKGATAKEAVKETVKEKVEEVKVDAKKKAKEEADKILADAQRQADRLVAEAKTQADKVRREGKNAANQIRSEADNKAKDLVREASNPFAKKAAEVAADKLRKEADKKAKQVEQEANKKADDIEAKAQNKADQIMQKARAEADAKLAE